MDKVSITPAIAQEMLTHNTNNRPLNKFTLSKYKQLMLDGKWGITPDAIAFDVDGVLLNGQHRLHAVVLSNTTQEFYVIKGLPKSSFSITDEGRKRQAADVLFVKTGTLNAIATAAIIRTYILLHNDQYSMTTNNASKRTSPTNDDFVIVFNKHKDIFMQAFSLSKKCYKKLNFLTAREIGGVFSYLVIDKQYEQGYVRKFFEELFFNIENNKTVTLLRDRLIKDKISKSTLRYSVKMSLIAKTWNAWVADRVLRTLKLSDEKVRFN